MLKWVVTQKKSDTCFNKFFITYVVFDRRDMFLIYFIVMSRVHCPDKVSDRKGYSFDTPFSLQSRRCCRDIVLVTNHLIAFAHTVTHHPCLCFKRDQDLILAVTIPSIFCGQRRRQNNRESWHYLFLIQILSGFFVQ